MSEREELLKKELDAYLRKHFRPEGFKIRDLFDRVGTYATGTPTVGAKYYARGA